MAKPITLAPLPLPDLGNAAEDAAEPILTDKVWYCTGVTLSHKYALCLLKSVELLESGAKAIYHFQSERYYNDLLEHKSDGLSLKPRGQRRLQHRRALENDGAILSLHKMIEDNGCFLGSLE